MALRSPAGQLGSSLQGKNTGTASIASLTNWYSGFYDLLLSPALFDPEAVVRRLIDGVREKLGKGAVVEFNYLAQRAETTALLSRALRSAGLITFPYYHELVRYEIVKNTNFDSYLEQCSAGIRREYMRKGRRLAEHFKLEQVAYSDDSQLDRVLDDFQHVYAKSWKRPERFPKFIPELFRYGLAKQQLRVAILYLDGQPVATEVYILFNGQATSYKGGYDPAYKNFSPASVLRVFAVKHLIEVDGVSEIDFGYGDQPYKKNWLSQGRWLIGILAFNPHSLTGWNLLLAHINGIFMVKIRQLARRMVNPFFAI
jgi:CelD/BcsL family acetyltransferase involved in cellulose biosynthesis